MYHKFVTFHKHNQGAEFQVSYNTQKSIDNTMATHAFVLMLFDNKMGALCTFLPQ